MRRYCTAFWLLLGVACGGGDPAATDAALDGEGDAGEVHAANGFDASGCADSYVLADMAVHSEAAAHSGMGHDASPPLVHSGTTH